jgi:hypothetical protein
MPHRVCLMNQLEHANNMEIPSYRTGLHEIYLKTPISLDQPQENETIPKRHI